MDNLVFKKFDLKRNQLNKELEQELIQIKNQLVARNAYHSGASIKIQCDAIIKNCSLKLDALIKVYEEIENEIEQGYIVKNEANIRKEFNEVLNSEYGVCDHRIVRIYSEFKVGRSDIHTLPQIRQEAETKLDILIESVKRKEVANKQPGQVVMRELKKYSCGPLGNPECNQRDFIEKEFSDKKIFLDIPYTDYEEQESLLRDVVGIAKLDAVVAKDRLTSNAVLCKVCKIVQSCKYGIADISLNRHSVTYELGLMHGFGKKVCILLQEDSEKFSDILGLEHTSYCGIFELKIKFAKWLIHNVPESDVNSLEAFVEEQNKQLQKNGEARFQPKKNSVDYLESAQKFRDERIARISAGELPTPFEGNSKILLHLIPIASIKNKKTYDIKEITTRPISLPPIMARGWDIGYNIDGFYTYTGNVREKSHAYTQLYKSGIIEAVEGSLIREYGEGKKAIPSELFEGKLINALDSYLKVMDSLKIDLPILLFLTLLNVKGYTITFMRPSMNPFYRPSSIDKDVLCLPEVKIESYASQPKQILKPCFDTIWNACGAAGSPNYD